MPVVQLADYAQVLSGYAFKGKDFSEDGYPVIKIKNIQDRSVIPDFTVCVPEEVTGQKIEKFRIVSGDILIAMTGQGSVGRVGKLRLQNTDRCYLNQRVGKIYSTSVHLHSDFLYYIIQTREYEEYLFSLGAGSGQPNLSPSQITSIPIPLPSIEVQQAIAHILGTLDDKIELNKKMNQTLEEIAKAIFKSWFVDFDPVRAKAEGRPTGLPPEISDLFPDQLVDSEIGEIPKGWESTRISKIAKKVSEKYKKGEDWSEEKLIDLSRMPSKSIALNAHGKGAELSTSVCKFKKYDFLFGSIRPYFYKAGICPFDGVSNTSVFILRSIEDFDREFIYLYSSSAQVFEQSIQYSDGTKMPIIKWQDFQDFSFALPDKTLRKHFSEIVRPMVERLICNVEEEKVLSELRDTLLPKLISGELRIPDAEKFLEEAGI